MDSRKRKGRIEQGMSDSSCEKLAKNAKMDEWIARREKGREEEGEEEGRGEERKGRRRRGGKTTGILIRGKK